MREDYLFWGKDDTFSHVLNFCGQYQKEAYKYEYTFISFEYNSLFMFQLKFIRTQIWLKLKP